MNIDYIQDKINDQREKLLKHKLYSNIETIKDLQVFTENHVYAVWDFMSLLKALQIKLTCTKTPWVPNSNSQTAYLINEIVLAEETDINQAGERKSHYELYLDAMIDIGARTKKPVEIINEIANSEDIFNTIDSYPEDHESGIKLQQTLEGNVEIENVSFSYLEHSDPVLKEISISAKKGETIALVGRSGSGKSTIVNLLNRFYDSFEGKITIDGYDIRKINLKDLREAISYVSQDPVLFNDTIRNNITYG